MRRGQDQKLIKCSQDKKFINKRKMSPGHGKEGRGVPSILENLGIDELDCVQTVYCIFKILYRPSL